MVNATKKTRTKKRKSRNTRQITNRAVVRARILTWKNADVGASSLYGYTRKIKEFHEFCTNNEPSVLLTERQANTLQKKLKLPDTKKIACQFNLAKLKLSGYEAIELFFGSKLKEDGTNYTKEYYGGYRSAFKKIFAWQKDEPICCYKCYYYYYR